MKITFKQFLRTCFSFIIIAGLVYYLWRHWDVFYTTLEASWINIISLVLCIFMTLVLNSLQVLLLLRHIGVKVGFWENMFVLIAMIFGNYLPMRMGSLLRMRYFKTVHGLQYTKFIGITGVRTVILIASTGILGSVSLVGLSLSGFPFNMTLLCIFIIMLVFSIGVCRIPATKIKKTNNLLQRTWSNLFNAFEKIQTHPALFWQILGLILMQYAFLALRLSITFDAIQVEVSPWAFLMLAPMTVLLGFVSLTPGNLGLREWAIGVMSLASGINFHSGIFAGTLDRAVLMACIFILGSASLAYVWFRIGRMSLADKDIT